MMLGLVQLDRWESTAGEEEDEEEGEEVEVLADEEGLAAQGGREISQSRDARDNLLSAACHLLLSLYSDQEEEKKVTQGVGKGLQDSHGMFLLVMENLPLTVKNPLAFFILLVLVHAFNISVLFSKWHGFLLKNK